MKTHEKLLVLIILIISIFLIGCSGTPVSYNAFEPVGGDQIEEARNSIKAIVKDMVDVTKINLTQTEFIRYYDDGSSYITSFNDMYDPKLEYDMGYYNVQFGDPGIIYFTQEGPAKKFASALAYLKNNYAKKGERGIEKEREDSLRRIQQTAIEEKKERDKKQEESLRLIRKTGVQEETSAARDEGITESATPRKKSQPRPAPPKKSAVEPPQRPPEVGSPAPPALPSGGAVSGY
jgi:hypothetical protein